MAARGAAAAPAAAPPTNEARPRSATTKPGTTLATCLSIGGSRAPHHYARHIVLGVDEARPSHAALQWAAQHLYRDGDMFHLVYVLPPPDTLHAFPGVFVPPDDAEEAEEFQEATALVRSTLAPILNDHGVPAKAHLVIAPANADAVADLLAAKAQELGAAALVVASSGKSRVQELWTGSVAQRLTRKSHVPVVVHRE